MVHLQGEPGEDEDLSALVARRSKDCSEER